MFATRSTADGGTWDVELSGDFLVSISSRERADHIAEQLNRLFADDRAVLWSNDALGALSAVLCSTWLDGNESG